MVYIKTNNLSITHEDQEVDNLKFTVLASKDGVDYVEVEGTDTKILAWKTRVEGGGSTIDEINTIIASLPKTGEALLEEKATNLETQLAQTNSDMQGLMQLLAEKSII